MNPYILLIFSYYSDMYIIVFNHTSKNVSSRLQWNCINRWYRMGKRKALILTSPINLLTFHTLPRENICLSYHLNFAPCPCPSPSPGPARRSSIVALSYSFLAKVQSVLWCSSFRVLNYSDSHQIQAQINVIFH